MDAIVILILSIVFMTLSKPEAKTADNTSNIQYEVLQRDTKLNEDFYDDPEAFRRIVHELGF